MHFKIEYSDTELKNELWKDIPNYEGIYEASSLGRIRTNINKTSSSARFKIRHWKQRILKYKSHNENAYKTGYRVDLWKDGKHKTYLVARLVASAFIRDELCNKKLTVNHINGNRLDNRVENLEWLTLGDNIREGFKTGLYTAQKKIKITEKLTKKSRTFNSLASASRYYYKSNGYFSDKISKGKYSNKELEWCLL